MTTRFPLRRCWATRMLWPMVRGEVEAEVGEGRVCIRLGLLGRADVDVTQIARLSTMHWPWWGGLGARLGRHMVAFTLAWGEAAVIELIEPIDVRAPMRWRTTRVIIGVDDATGFVDAIAREREAATPTASR